LEINRFTDWKYPDIENGKAPKYNWGIQNSGGLKFGFKTDFDAFSYINTISGGNFKDIVQTRFNDSIYSISKTDNLAGEFVFKQNCKIESRTSIFPTTAIVRNSKIIANSLVNIDIYRNLIAFGIPVKIAR